jgi:hypothetical protein
MPYFWKLLSIKTETTVGEVGGSEGLENRVVSNDSL